MHRRHFLQQIGTGILGLGAAGIFPVLTSCGRRMTAQPPNLLIIITDDQGYGDVSAYAHHARDISTPNIDRLASGGVKFTQAYVTAPVCSPSRAGWNTGMYQNRWDPRGGWNPGLPGNVKTLAEYLKAAGYVTGKTGKSDFGSDYHRQEVREYPLNHGFDEFLGFSSHAHDYFLLSEEVEAATPDPHGHSAALGPLFENRTRRSIEAGYTTEVFTDWAVDFLRRHQEERFFLSVSYNAVHHLIHEVPDRYLEKYNVSPIPNYNPKTMGNYQDYYLKYNQLGAIPDEQMRQYYLANLACLDDNIGRLLDALDELGLSEDTLVLFFSDNGGSPLTGANNRPLRGSKYILYDGGIRVPFIMRWPGVFSEGQLYPYRISTYDILPTCLEASGVGVPDGLDGQSMLEAVRTGNPAPSGTEPLFWEFRGQYAVLDGDWKLVKTDDQSNRPPTSQILGGPPSHGEVQLFNITEDPQEQRNVYDEYPAVADRMEQLYRDWRAEMESSPLDARDGE